MSVRRLAEIQPESFAFTPENEAAAAGGRSPNIRPDAKRRL